MKTTHGTARIAAGAAALWLSGASLAVHAGVVSGELAQQLALRGAKADVAVIVEFDNKIDPRSYAIRDRRQRNNSLLTALRNRATVTLAPMKTLLASYGIDTTDLWMINGVAATVPPGLVPLLADFPGVQSVRLDQMVNLPYVTQGAPAAAQWNIAAIGAPDVWASGHSGAGAIVANMDTGVDPTHPDLAAKWRGGTNSWYDPYGQYSTPHDSSGHGTQTMGLIVGGSASGTAIGVAPDATWIAARVFNDAGQGTLSKIHLAFQWLLDPDGNPLTIDAPDVVNGSWNLTSGPIGSCSMEFDTDVRTLKAAGIAVVFSAGNEGPAPGTSDSPANNPEGFSAGAVDAAQSIADFSSRGPSGCDGTLFPKVVAPGVDVWTADLSYGGVKSYTSVSGTSFAAPHVAGAIALLAEAFPAASVAEMESALAQGALDLGAAGADASYGYGLVSVAAAYNVLLAGVGSPPVITSTPVTTAIEAAPYAYQVTATDPGGSAITYSLATWPAGMSIGAASGAITWTPARTQVGANQVRVRATNARNLTATQTFTVIVAAINHPPVAANDSYAAVSGTALNIAAPGVLANDSDPDANPLNAVLAAPPAHGVLTLNANGSFSYTATAGYVGTDSFAYSASDGQLSSNVASVSINVAPPNRAPVAANDSYSVVAGSSLAVAAPGLLGNDSDPDGNAITATLASGPAHGTLSLNANGSFTYTPSAGYKGTDSFTYKAFDGQLASNAATVTITIAANQPPVAANDAFVAPYRGGGSYATQVFNVLANDRDPDGSLNPASVRIASQPNRGGSVTANANGTVSYSPKRGYRGTEVFTYNVKDDRGATSNTASVTVTVQ